MPGELQALMSRAGFGEAARAILSATLWNAREE